MRNFLWILALLSALMCSTLASTSVEAQEYVKTFCPNGGSLGCWEVDKSSIQERGDYVRYWQKRGTFGMSSDVVLTFKEFHTWVEVDCRANHYRIAKYVFTRHNNSTDSKDGEMVWKYADPDQAIGAEARAICKYVGR